MGIAYIDDKYLTQIGNAIRSKVGGSTQLKPEEMSDAITTISGSGGSSSAYWTINITPTSNQTIRATVTPAPKSGTSSFTLSSLDVPTVTATVTPSSGYIAGTASVSRSGTTFTVSATAATARPAGNGSLTIYIPSDSNTYDVGDEITINAILFNDSNETMEDIEVICDLTNEYPIISSLEPGESYSLPMVYTVAEADILEGSVICNIAASWNGNDVYQEQTYTTANANGSLLITIAENNTSYQANDTVPVTWTVTNNGNLTLTDIHIVCDESGDENTILELAPGDTDSDTWFFTATSSWIEDGGYVTVYGTATSPDPDYPDADVTSAEVQYTVL